MKNKDKNKSAESNDAYDPSILLYDLIEDTTRKEGVKKFAIESNKIEGIFHDDEHINHYEALERFLRRPFELISIEEFVYDICRRPLRSLKEHMVMIGGRVAPAPDIMLPRLNNLIANIKTSAITPHDAHVEYEMLHPFMDGNGRSGRAIWLWMMFQCGWNCQRDFLHQFYYSTLATHAKNWKI